LVNKIVEEKETYLIPFIHSGLNSKKNGVNEYCITYLLRIFASIARIPVSTYALQCTLFWYKHLVSVTPSTKRTIWHAYAQQRKVIGSPLLITRDLSAVKWN